MENCTSMGGSILACSASRALTRSSAAPAASRSPAVPPPAISASILRNFARSSSSLATTTPNIRHEQAIPPAAAQPTNIQGAVATTLTFRGRRGDLLKALVWDGQGLVLYAKRLEKGRFIWPQAKTGTITLTNAQLSMLVEGIDWRMPAWTARPEVAA